MLCISAEQQRVQSEYYFSFSTTTFSSSPASASLPCKSLKLQSWEKLQQVFELLLLLTTTLFCAVLGLFDSSSDRVPDTAQVSQDEKEDLVVLIQLSTFMLDTLFLLFWCILQLSEFWKDHWRQKYNSNILKVQKDQRPEMDKIFQEQGKTLYLKTHTVGPCVI